MKFKTVQTFDDIKINDRILMKIRDWDSIKLELIIGFENGNERGPKVIMENDKSFYFYDFQNGKNSIKEIMVVS